MCGITGQNFHLKDFCRDTERCTGPSKDDPAFSFVPSKDYRYRTLCTRGMLLLLSTLQPYSFDT